MLTTVHPQGLIHWKAAVAETKPGGGMELYKQYKRLTRDILPTGFYENSLSFLLIPYPFDHGRYDFLTW